MKGQPGSEWKRWKPPRVAGGLRLPPDHPHIPWVALSSGASEKKPSGSWRGQRCGELGNAVSSHVEEMIRCPQGRRREEGSLESQALEDEIVTALVGQWLEALRAAVPAARLRLLGGGRAESTPVTFWKVWVRPVYEPALGLRAGISVRHRPDWTGPEPAAADCGSWTHLPGTQPLLQALHEAHGSAQTHTPLALLRAAHEELHLAQRPLRPGAIDVPALSPEQAREQARGLLELCQGIFDEAPLRQGLALIGASAGGGPEQREWSALQAELWR